MKKYNRDKRSKYKQDIHTAHNHNNESCDGEEHKTNIRIKPKYDGYKRTKYTTEVYIRTRRTNTYVSETNAINDIFPDLNEPHNAHIYAANAPYKRFIPPRPDIPYMPPADLMEEYKYKHTDTSRKKCIIFNSKDEMIYYGIFTRTIDINGHDITITLHRSDRSIEVRTYWPVVDEIKGVKVKDIYKNGIEFYRVY